MAFDEQFSLRWNEFQTKLSSGFHAMMEQGALLDVTLGAGGQFIQAHKLVLAICSTYFKQLFEINPCKHPIVILKDVELKELQAIIQFMYKGEVSVSQQDLPAFLKTAEMLQISGLTDNSAEKSHPALQQPKMLPPKPTRISSSPRSMPAMKRFRPELPLPVRDPQKPPPLHCAPNIPEKKFRSDPSISTEAPTIQTQPYSEPASLQNSEGRSVDLHSVKTEPAPIEILDESDEHEQLVSDNMYTEEDSNQMDDTKMSPPDAFNESRLIANQMSEPSSSQAVPQGTLDSQMTMEGKSLSTPCIPGLDPIFADVGDHQLEAIVGGKKKYPQKQCRVCAVKKVRKETRYICSLCRVPLHKGDCFQWFHSAVLQ